MILSPNAVQLGSLTTTMTSRRNWVILRRESHGRSSRLELYRNEEQVADNNFGRDILLDQMRSVQRAERKKAFVVVTAEETLLFMCSSRADTDDWLSDIRRYRSGRRSESGSDGIPDNSLGHDIYEGMHLYLNCHYRSTCKWSTKGIYTCSLVPSLHSPALKCWGVKCTCTCTCLLIGKP